MINKRVSCSKPWRISFLVVSLYFLLSVIWTWVAGDALYQKTKKTDMLTAMLDVGEIYDGKIIEQPFHTTADQITGITLFPGTYQRNNSGELVIDILKDEDLLTSQSISVTEAPHLSMWYIPFDAPINNIKNQKLSLKIYSKNCKPQNSITLYYGNGVKLSRGNAEIQMPEEDYLIIDGQKVNGMLSFSLTEVYLLWFGDHMWAILISIGVLLTLFVSYQEWCRKHGKTTLLLRTESAFKKYKFLIEQLVSRDFKTKYKRSVLGVLWSFMNPLLTMLVQYIVFSTLFKSDIPNFPIYLLSGIVCFSFFSEAANMALMSIVGNANLISKVYVPKYIYPLSRTLSSTINLLLSLIPLFLVMLFMHTPFTKAILLLPYALINLFVLSFGIGLLLATCMVFFRDTQFLWGVISMIWMYLTPIFYPISIIPLEWRCLYEINPMYQIISFVRTILIEGISPEPINYLMCLLGAAIPLVIGSMVFLRYQDRFVLNV